MGNQYIVKGNLTANYYSGPTTTTVAGNQSIVSVMTGSVNGISQSIALNTWTAINTGSVVNPSYVYFQNAETASYNIDIGIKTGATTASFATLKPLDFVLLKASSSAVYYAKATVSASVLNVVMGSI
jgi:hypothetical protein